MNDGFHLEIKLEVEMVLEMVQEKIWTNWAVRHITARNKADKPGQSLNWIFVRNPFHALYIVVFGNMELQTAQYARKQHQIRMLQTVIYGPKTMVLIENKFKSAV